MKNLFLILIISLTVTGCSYGSSNTEKEVKNIDSAVDSSEIGNTDLNHDLNTDLNENETTETGNDNIKVFNINNGDTVTSPLKIEGEALAFEDNLIVELRNVDHETMVKEFTIIKSDEVGVPGPFSITLNYVFNNTKEGYIAVYEESAKDGSERNLVEIAVKFGDSVSYIIDELNIKIDYLDIDCRDQFEEEIDEFCKKEFGNEITKENIEIDFNKTDVSNINFVDSWLRPDYIEDSITEEILKDYNTKYDNYTGNLDNIYKISLRLKNTKEDFQEISRLFLTENTNNLVESDLKYWNYCEAGCPLWPEKIVGNFIVWRFSLDPSTGAGNKCGFTKRKYSGDDDKMCEAYLNIVHRINYIIN